MAWDQLEFSLSLGKQLTPITSRSADPINNVSIYN